MFENKIRRYFFYGHPVDMRKSFDGLIGVTKRCLGEDPLSGDAYIFVNRKENYLKLLYWDRTGFCLYAKRLERGKFRIFVTSDKQEINEQQLSLLLDGITLGRRPVMR